MTPQHADDRGGVTHPETTAPAAGTPPVAALMVALLTACVAFQLNASMLSPALVTMGEELGADPAAIGMSQTWFFTAAAVFSLFLPRLSDVVGRRKVLTVMLVLMAGGSVVSALAPNVGWLFVGRIIQGVCGPTVPIALIMLRSAITDNRRYGTMMGIVTAVNGGIAGVDAFLGGYLAEHYGFRSLFWFMVVCGLVAAGLVATQAPESKPQAGTRMDWAGVVFIVVAVGALLTALNEAAALPTAFSSRTLLISVLLVVLAAVCFAAFWRTERRVQEPMVQVEHLRRRATWAPLLTTTLTMTGIFAVINGIIPGFVQAKDPGFDANPTATALLILTPYAIVGWIAGPFTGRLAPTVGYRTLLRAGLIGSVIALALAATVGLGVLWVMIAAVVLLGVAYAGTANIMLNGLGVALSPPGNPGFLPGMNAGAFNLGAGLSFLILPAIQVAVGGGTTRASFVTAIMTGLVITVAAFAASLLIPRPAEAEVESAAVAVGGGH